MKHFFLGISGVALLGIGAAGFFLNLDYWGWWLVAGLLVISTTHDSWS